MSSMVNGSVSLTSLPVDDTQLNVLTRPYAQDTHHPNLINISTSILDTIMKQYKWTVRLVSDQ